MRQDSGSTVDAWHGRGDVIAVNPQVRNVQGEMTVRPQRGAAGRFTYICTFRTDENDRLAAVDYSRK